MGGPKGGGPKGGGPKGGGPKAAGVSHEKPETKLAQKTPKEGRKERILPREREKRAKFWVVRGRAVRGISVQTLKHPHMKPHSDTVKQVPKPHRQHTTQHNTPQQNRIGQSRIWPKSITKKGWPKSVCPKLAMTHPFGPHFFWVQAPTPGPHPSGNPPLRTPTRNKNWPMPNKDGQCGQLTLAKCGIGQIRPRPSHSEERPGTAHSRRDQMFEGWWW